MMDELNEILEIQQEMKAQTKETTMIVIWGLPKGETERYTEVVLSSHCKTPADIAKVKAAASADG